MESLYRLCHLLLPEDPSLVLLIRDHEPHFDALPPQERISYIQSIFIQELVQRQLIFEFPNPVTQTTKVNSWLIRESHPTLSGDMGQLLQQIGTSIYQLGYTLIELSLPNQNRGVTIIPNIHLVEALELAKQTGFHSIKQYPSSNHSMNFHGTPYKNS